MTEFADDAVLIDSARPEPVRGRAAIHAVTQPFRDGIPDLQVEVLRAVSDGAIRIEEWHATGHQHGELLGVPASGAEIDLTGCTVKLLDEDGLVTEARVYWSPLSLMQQIGAAPAEAIA